MRLNNDAPNLYIIFIAPLTTNRDEGRCMINWSSWSYAPKNLSQIMSWRRKPKGDSHTIQKINRAKTHNFKPLFFFFFSNQSVSNVDLLICIIFDKLYFIWCSFGQIVWKYIFGWYKYNIFLFYFWAKLILLLDVFTLEDEKFFPKLWVMFHFIHVGRSNEKWTKIRWQILRYIW